MSQWFTKCFHFLFACIPKQNDECKEHELEDIPVVCLPPLKSFIITTPTPTPTPHNKKTPIPLSLDKPKLRRQFQICDESWNVVEDFTTIMK